MEKLIYKKRGKALLFLIQMAAAGVLVYCVLHIGFWMGGSYSLQEMSRSYEESELFFRQVDEILKHKIRGQENRELFETDGEFDPNKEVDIRSYGEKSSAVKDMNTTYRLGDLLEFYESGDRLTLHNALASVASLKDPVDPDADEKLAKQAAELETILPVTGISLEECSRWYSEPGVFLVETYRRLDESTWDIYGRYREYTSEQDESWLAEAPSNLRYCIENTAAGILYTNTGKKSYTEAVQSSEEDSRFHALYEGERSFNIMVTNQDNVLNYEAEKWFMEKRYVNTNEKVYIAVDTEYPVGDSLQKFAGYFAKRETIVWGALAVAVLSAGVLAVCFILIMAGAGWREGRVQPELLKIDHVPLELSAGLYLIIAVMYLLFWSVWGKAPVDIADRERLIVSAAAASAWAVFCSASTGFMRRYRTKTLWSNSICRMLARTWKQVMAVRAASGQLLFFYLIFFALNFLFLLLFKRFGIFMVFVLDMAVLLLLLRDMAGKQSVWEGIHKISGGDLEYKIDTTALQGETYEMARAINEMGDGLQKAIDAIVKNERLKAELITNVSHDIKTPLTSIVNYVDLLKREDLQGERVQHYLEVLDQKSQRLRQLTEDLVEASKISSGNIELQMMKMQFQSMLQQAYGEFQERFEERSLAPVWNLEKEPVLIMADGRQLWRILENLFGNIYKYALEDTRVYISLQSREGRAYLAIRNTSREKLTVDGEELMGRFVRGDRSRSTEGSGLGLSIAQSLVELQDGTFEITVDGDLFKVILSFPIIETKEKV